MSYELRTNWVARSSFAWPWLMICLVLFLTSTASAASARRQVAEGNAHYRGKQFDKALESYDSALKLDPKSPEAAYNRANSLYRQQNYDGAIDAFSSAAAAARKEDLAVRAKFNLGNSYFKKAQTLQDKPKIENLEKAVDCWRQVQEMKPDHPSVSQNIETAKLLMQQEQQKQKQQQPQQGGQDPNQPPQQNQTQDPNQPSDQKQQQQSQQDQQQKEQQQKQQQSQQSEQKDEQTQAAQATADQIIKEEDKSHEKRRIFLLQQQPVEKDW